METKKGKIKTDLSTRYSNLVEDCCAAIQKNLALLYRTFSDDDDEPLRFFVFSSTSNESIIKIYPNGYYEIASGEKESIVEMIQQGKIPFDNAIALAEELIILSEASSKK